MYIIKNSMSWINKTNREMAKKCQTISITHSWRERSPLIWRGLWAHGLTFLSSLHIRNVSPPCILISPYNIPMRLVDEGIISSLRQMGQTKHVEMKWLAWSHSEAIGELRLEPQASAFWATLSQSHTMKPSTPDCHRETVPPLVTTRQCPCSGCQGKGKMHPTRGDYPLRKKAIQTSLNFRVYF